MDKLKHTPAEATTFSAGVRGDRRSPATPDRLFNSPIEMANAGIGVSSSFIEQRWGVEAAIQYTAIMAQRIKRSNYSAAR